MYHCDAGLLFILERFYKDAVNSQQQRDDGGDSAHKGPHSDRAGGGGGGDAHNYDPTASLHDMTAMVTDLLADYFLAAMAFDDAVHLCKRESNREARANPELWRRVLTHLVLRCELRSGIDGGGGGGGVVGMGGNAFFEPPVMVSGSAVPVRKCENEEELEDAHELLQEFLADIEADKILPPLAVMQILAMNPTLPLSVAKDFLMSFTLYVAVRATATSFVYYFSLFSVCLSICLSVSLCLSLSLSFSRSPSALTHYPPYPP